jgi:hypothetical protein
MYFVSRDVSSEKRVEETLRTYLLSTRRAPAAKRRRCPQRPRLTRCSCRCRASRKRARSHDLRTPCHGMQCASQLLAARPAIAADADAVYLLNAVRASCRLMLTTVDNVLSLKLLEAEAASGRAQPLHDREPLDVRALLADVLDVCRVGCLKDITWLNEHDAVGIPAVLEVRAFIEANDCRCVAASCELTACFPLPFCLCRARSIHCVGC